MELESMNDELPEVEEQRNVARGLCPCGGKKPEGINARLCVQCAQQTLLGDLLAI